MRLTMDTKGASNLWTMAFPRRATGSLEDTGCYLETTYVKIEQTFLSEYSNCSKLIQTSVHF